MTAISWPEIYQLMDEVRELRMENERLKKQNMELEAQVGQMMEALEKAEAFINSICSFYGEGLQVHGWHLNGDPEPFDNFIDDNSSGSELEDIRQALQTPAHARGENMKKVVDAAKKWREDVLSGTDNEPLPAVFAGLRLIKSLEELEGCE